MMCAKLLSVGGGSGLVISASCRNPDVRALAISSGWDGAGPIELRINAGVDVAGLFIPASIPNNCLTVVNRGRIGGVINSGKGLHTLTRIAVDNTGGTIQGSGGRGGAGGQVMISSSDGSSAVGSPGQGGNGAGFSDSGAVALLDAQYGSYGTTRELVSESIGGQPQGTSTGGTGGRGGALNQAGGYGSNGSVTGAFASAQVLSYGSQGQPAGPAVDGDSKITWQALGTISGTRVN